MMSCERSGPETAGIVPHGAVRQFGPRQQFPECLGPMPEASLASLVDLGLSDAEIAGYFRLDPARVAGLTRAIRAGMAA
jgi:hypothetical protein